MNPGGRQPPGGVSVNGIYRLRYWAYDQYGGTTIQFYAFRNQPGVKLGYDPKGDVKFVRFSDIERLEVRKGIRGEVMVIHLKDRKLKYPYRHNKEVFDLLQHKYEAFQEIQRSPVSG